MTRFGTTGGVNLSRRRALMTTLFGAGAVGLRALATGLPAAFFLNPRKALANPPGCSTPAAAQYIIFSTSGAGDPINASSPGTYGDPNIVHSPDPSLAPTTLTIQGQTYTAGKPWASLPQAVLDRTTFWHIMTNTPVHPKEPQVLELMGAAAQNEMLPSLLAKAIAPCLNTIQAQPLSIGAAGPGEALSYAGSTLPIIPPLALKDTLTSPTGPLTQLQSIRDETMTQLYALYKNGATPSQQTYMDSMINSQQQLRSIKQSLLGALATIQDNSVASQITAAIALIQMNVAPVIAIHIPFGGDNHSDPQLVMETAQTVSGVASIASLMSQLQSAGLQDQVTFMTLNVFGRTLGTSAGVGVSIGRGHNPNHQVSITIGKPFKGGVVGGCVPVQLAAGGGGMDYGATGIDSSTGAGTSSGDIAAADTLGAFGQTMLAAVGGDPTVISTPTGKVIAGALA
jgi:hypothetical protein